MSTGLGIEKTVTGAFDDVVEKTITTLKGQGFGVLTDIDVKATLKEKLGEDFINYRILGACNPPIALKALRKSYDVGLMMPCNVVVYEKAEGEITVSAVSPKALMANVEGVDLADVADEAEEKLTTAINAL